MKNTLTFTLKEMIEFLKKRNYIIEEVKTYNHPGFVWSDSDKNVTITIAYQPGQRPTDRELNNDCVTIGFKFGIEDKFFTEFKRVVLNL